MPKDTEAVGKPTALEKVQAKTCKSIAINRRYGESVIPACWMLFDKHYHHERIAPNEKTLTLNAANGQHGEGNETLL